MGMKLSWMMMAVTETNVKSYYMDDFFLRLLLRAPLVDVAWRRVASVQPASRQTTCCRLGNKTFGCCVYC